jgi:hypothetical protein
MIVLAYIDPGSGSMLIQMLIAGALAIPIIFRNAIASAWHRLRGSKESGRSAPGERSEPNP